MSSKAATPAPQGSPASWELLSNEDAALQMTKHVVDPSSKDYSSTVVSPSPGVSDDVGVGPSSFHEAVRLSDLLSHIDAQLSGISFPEESAGDVGVRLQRHFSKEYSSLKTAAGGSDSELLRLVLLALSPRQADGSVAGSWSCLVPSSPSAPGGSLLVPVPLASLIIRRYLLPPSARSSSSGGPSSSSGSAPPPSLLLFKALFLTLILLAFLALAAFVYVIYTIVLPEDDYTTQTCGGGAAAVSQNAR